MNKNDKKKNKLQEIFEESPEMKPIFFFGFYIIFFIFLAAIFRGTFKVTDVKLNRYNSGYNHNFNLDNIRKNNYHYFIKVTKNSDVIVFEGDKSNNNLEFIMSGEIASEYKFQNGKYYRKNVNSLLYEETDNPMEFSYLIDNDGLNTLFTRGTYISKTDYLNQKETDYNYEISTTTMLNRFLNIESDLDGINKIIAKVDNSDNLYEIDIDVSDFYKYFDENIYQYKIEIKYSKFGKIEEFK